MKSSFQRWSPQLQYKLIYSSHNDSDDDRLSDLLNCLKGKEQMLVAEESLDFCSEQNLIESILIVPMVQFGPG